MRSAFLAASLVAAASLAVPAAQAAGIESVYTNLGGNVWSVDFTVIHDGSPLVDFTGFTIDFLSATNLSLVQSPVTWDSLVIQPDPGLPDNGFLDSLALNPTAALSPGESIGGFRVAFTWTDGTPGALPFLIIDADNIPVFSGMTSVVPEPGAAWLFAIGLSMAGFRVVRSRARRAAEKNNASNEVTA